MENKYGAEYKIISASNGNECLELLKNNEIPNLILLDIMMPEMSGWEVFDKLKDNQSWKNIPVVFLTARTDRFAKNAGELLADTYIEKPVDIKELTEQIDKILER